MENKDKIIIKNTAIVKRKQGKIPLTEAQKKRRKKQ
jgi:hypothetical protein